MNGWRGSEAAAETGDGRFQGTRQSALELGRFFRPAGGIAGAAGIRSGTVA